MSRYHDFLPSPQATTGRPGLSTPGLRTCKRRLGPGPLDPNSPTEVLYWLPPTVRQARHRSQRCPEADCTNLASEQSPFGQLSHDRVKRCVPGSVSQELAEISAESEVVLEAKGCSTFPMPSLLERHKRTSKDVSVPESGAPL